MDTLFDSLEYLEREPNVGGCVFFRYGSIPAVSGLADRLATWYQSVHNSNTVTPPATPGGTTSRRYPRGQLFGHPVPVPAIYDSIKGPSPCSSYLTRDYELTYSHIDWRGTARPSAYFDFMQDAATVPRPPVPPRPRRHRRPVGALAHACRVLPVRSRPYDTLRVTTWCAGIKGPSWLRAFSFAVDWPAGRAGDVQLGHPGHGQPPYPAAEPDRAGGFLCLPGPRGAAHAGQAGCQRPGPAPHAPPSCTPTWTSTATSTTCASRRSCLTRSTSPRMTSVRSLQINYTAETPAGLTLFLYAARTADTFRVRGEAAGKVRFEAAGTFGRLD